MSSTTEQLLFEEKVDFVFSPYFPSLTQAAKKKTVSAKKLFLIPVGTFLDNVRNYSYLSYPSVSAFPEAAFKSFSQQQATNISVLVDDNLGGMCTMDVTFNVAAQYSNQINMTGYYVLPAKNNNITAYRQHLKTILIDMQKNNVQTILGCSLSILCFELVFALKEMDYNLKGIMFVFCASNPAIIEAIGRDAEHLLAVSLWSITDSIKCAYTGWTGKDFSDRYYRLYSQYPTYHSGNFIMSYNISHFRVDECL